MISNHPVLTDYVTGRPVLDVGPEANRQAVEKFLVENKGYDKSDILVDMPLRLDIGGKPYDTRLDLVVQVDGNPFMVIRCVAGSLDSREREVIYAARVAGKTPMPVAAASDGHTALVFDAIRRKPSGEGLEAIPSPDEARKIAASSKVQPISADRLEKEKIIFRSYDIQNVNFVENGCCSD